MAAKKPPMYTVGPEYRYWPVYEGTRVVALCPNMSEAQAMVELLNRASAPPPKRSTER